MSIFYVDSASFGEVEISGSLTLTNNLAGTASYALTSSYVSLLNQNVDINGSLYVSQSVTSSVIANPDGDIQLIARGSNIASGSVEIHGGLKWKRTELTDAVEIGDLVTFGATMGLYDGGGLTTASIGGLVLQVEEMVAYTMATFPYETHDIIKFSTIGTSDASRQITLQPTSSVYVYYNNSGLLRTGSAAPSTRSNILLGRVTTNTTDIIYIDASPINAHHYSNYIDRSLRDTVGPLFAAGGLVTPGSSPGTLNVSAATYYFTETRITTNGASPITMDTYYRSSTPNVYVRTTGVTTVSTSSYDDGSGMLVSIPAGKYAKHALYLLGDNSLTTTAVESYLFVYGQALFDAAVDAEAGPLPTPPSLIADSIAVIASLIVTPDSSNIQEIVDERPRFGYISPSRAGFITVHSDLSGLSADDHTQYLLADGTRPMSGNLDMDNTYTITNLTSLESTFTGSLQGTASWAYNAQTSSYVLNAVSASFSSTASYVETAQTASYVVNAQTASYVQNAITASYILNAVSSSFAQTASYVLNAVSSSYSETSSYSANSELLDGNDSSVFATTGSNLFTATQTISGALQLNPTTDPGGLNTTLFVTSSADDIDPNLHYRNNGIFWKNHWLEERSETGLLWGGVLTFSGTTMSITPGAGLIVDHNANTSSYGVTTPTYVAFGPITASATFITSSQVTYLSIDVNGNLIQQTNIFTPQQYNEELVLGYIFCLSTSSISSYADARTTTYGQDEQQSQFIRAFGPLKVSGYDLTAQSGSLRLSIASGRAYRVGGFYSSNPNNPSIYDSNTITTASFVRVYRDPNIVGGFRATLNGPVPFTTIDPTMYDDGTGTLASVGASQWTIQRLFQGVVNGITYVYYGQNVYNTLASAIQSISTEPFSESQTSILALPFIGYVISKGDTTNLADTTNNSVINAGLFRNTAGSSGGGGVATTNLNDLSDVTITTPSTGEALVYSAGFWVNGTPLNSTSASYSSTASYVETAQTASYVETAQTASYVLNAVSSSYSTTSSYALTAQTLLGTVTSASYADTASYVLLAQTASYVTAAQTASYVLNAISASYANTAQTASYVLQAVSSSYAATASYFSRTVTRGGTVYDKNGITNNASYVIWRATEACTVSKIYAYREGGTATNVNALKNTSLLRSTDYSIASTGTWLDVGTLQNTSVVAGDAIYIVVSGSGASPTEIAIQIDLTI